VPDAASKANLLLVDDRPQNLLALEAILEPLGQNLVTANSGPEALKHLLHDDFAVILLDVQMPEMDGFETASLIKQREKTRSVPIIFLTAISKDSTHVFRGYSAGAVDYLFKPFDPEILRSKVAVFIELYEKTEQLKRQAEQLREQELAELRRESEEQYRFLAESVPDQVWTALPDGSLDYVNQRALDYFGRPFDDLIGWGWQSGLHPDDLPPTIALWTRALETGAAYEAEYRLLRASDGGYRWHITRAVPRRDRDGRIVKWFGTNTDIDDRKHAEQAQRFLVEASAVLGSSLEYRRTLVDVARLAVPTVADWCGVDILEDDGVIRQLAVAHADSAKAKFARELQERYPPAPDAQRGTPQVIRSGRAELVPVVTEEMIQGAAIDDLHLGLIRELGLRSYMCVPLVARGRTLGAISFVAAESGRHYDEDDLVLAEELARRAATAVDNAQLYREAEERARAARVLNSVGDGVFLVDGDGVIRLWNRAAEAITGLALADVLGRPLAEVVPGWTEIEGAVPVASSPGPGGGSAISVPLELDGRELWLSISGVGFDDGTVYAFRDLTEERVLETMRQDFVATVSHELRTPLAAIYGSALTIRRGDIDLEDEMRDQLLGIIAEESDRLARIVNDLLLASHLDSGRLEVMTQRTDARELVARVVGAAETHLPDGIEIVVEAPEKVPEVEADPGQLQQVLTNLLDNAVKYSPDGGAIRVTLEPGDRFLRFGVHDRGLGIPGSERNRIFEKFYRLDPNMTRGIGGTGLGLYICRELVRRVRGRIWVESEAGEGSSFFVEIPLAEAHKPSKQRKPARARAA
jgi:PAS domain S-box-containing protein